MLLVESTLGPQAPAQWQERTPALTPSRGRSRKSPARHKFQLPPNPAKENTREAMWMSRREASCLHQHSCTASRKNICNTQKTFQSWESVEQRQQDQVANSPSALVTAKLLKSTSNVKENSCYKSSLEVKQTRTQGPNKWLGQVAACNFAGVIQIRSRLF